MTVGCYPPEGHEMTRHIDLDLEVVISVDLKVVSFLTCKKKKHELVTISYAMHWYWTSSGANPRIKYNKCSFQ